MGCRHQFTPATGLVLLGALALCGAAGVTMASEHATPATTAAGGHAAPADAASDDPGALPGIAALPSALAEFTAPIEDGTDDPWTRWFDALEGDAGRTGPTLYPLDTPAEAPAAKPYRHLAIAKAVTQLEGGEPAGNEHGAHGDQDAGHGDHADARGAADHGHAAGSPLLALAQARNYLNLSEYDKALDWYGRVDARDPQGHFRRETGREYLAAAIAARDTVAAGRALATTMAAHDLAGREAEFVLAMRWLLGRRDATTLSWFVDRAAAPEFAADVRVTFWRAYALSWLERRAEALTELDRLLAMGGREQVLAPNERGWVLTAWADLNLLGGNHEAAGRCYRQLATSGMPRLRDWGRLQSATLSFVGNRYGEAAAGFREICQAETKGAWADHACAMAEMAARLERLLNEGERYGAAAHYGH